MSYSLKASALSLLVWLVSLAWPALPAGAVEPAIAPQTGVLVLRNGRILSGRITRAGDRYLVSLGAEDEISLPVDDVEFHCSGMREAYDLKRAALRPAHLEDRLDLADWCLRHELHREAAEQLLAAFALDSRAPRIAHLERRLQVALQGPGDSIHASGPAQPTVSVEEVERAVEALPAGVMERFASHIQPLLINRCGNGGCHGARGQSDFRLTAPSMGFRLTTRLTHRNLFDTLRYVDRGEPARSALIDWAGRVHGGLTSAVFREHEQDKVAQLRAWVMSLREDSASGQPPEVAGREPPGSFGTLGPVASASGPSAGAPPAYASPLLPSSAPGYLPGATPDRVQPAAMVQPAGMVQPAAMVQPGGVVQPGSVVQSGSVVGLGDSSGPGYSEVVRAGYEQSLATEVPGAAPVRREPGIQQSTGPNSVPLGQPTGNSGRSPAAAGYSQAGATPGSPSARAAMGRDPFDPEIFNRRYFPDPVRR